MSPEIFNMIKNFLKLIYGNPDKLKTGSLIKRNNKPPKGYDKANGTKP